MKCKMVGNIAFLYKISKGTVYLFLSIKVTTHKERKRAIMEILSHDENDVVRLDEAALRGSVATLNTLIQKDHLILSKVSLISLSGLPLHISAMLGHLDFVRSLLDLKPDLAGQLDSLKRSALHLASEEGHTEIVKALLGVNKDVCLVRDQDGRIPLHLAAMRGRVEVLKELISARPESALLVLDGGESVLHLCVKYNQLEALKQLEQLVNLKSKNQDRNTIFYMTVLRKQLETIRFSVSIPEAKATANALNGNGLTALDIITRCTRKDSEIRDVLIKDARPLKLCLRKGIQLLKRFGSYNWLQDAQGTLLLVATVIASMAFQVAISPPGGVWQETLDFNNSKCNPSSESTRNYLMHMGVKKCEVGSSVIAYKHPKFYLSIMTVNGVSFIGSLIVIFLILTGFPLKNRISMWLLLLAMGIAVTFMAITFVVVTIMLTPEELFNALIFEVFIYVVITWICLFLCGGSLHTL